MKKEVWKSIKGYEGVYEVSSLGGIRSLTRYVEVGSYSRISYGKVIGQFEDKDGYMIAQLSKDGKGKTIRVHSLVADAFLKKEDGRDEVNHIDSNKKNNSFDNLEYCNRSENMIHYYESGHANKLYGESNPNSKLKDSDIDEIKRLLGTGLYQKEIAYMFGVSQSTISLIKKGSIW